VQSELFDWRNAYFRKNAILACSNLSTVFWLLASLTGVFGVDAIAISFDLSRGALPMADGR
jgi:hypothetical protein